MSSVSLLLFATLLGADLSSDAGGDAVVVELEYGERVTAIRDTAVSLGPESVAWMGHLVGEPESSLVLSHDGGAVRGVLRSRRGNFRILAQAPSGYRAVALAPRDTGVERMPLAPNVTLTGETTPLVEEEPLDLLVVYTPGAREAAGSARAMAALVQLGVAEANLALERSGALARLRLVELREVDYVESGRVESDLEILRHAADGALDEVHALRDSFGADLVQLVVAEDDGCGISYLLPGSEPALASWAFSVVEWSCIDGALALAHELGHSLGCDHAPDDPRIGGAFEFSLGYRDPAERFRTVMAYAPGRRVARFSSSRVLWGGLPTGSESQDNARTIDRLRGGATRFRPSLPPPGLTLVSGVGISSGSAELRILPSPRPAAGWWVVAGTTPGGRDLYDSGALDEPRTLHLADLAEDGRTVYIRLFYRPGHVWLHVDFRFSSR